MKPSFPLPDYLQSDAALADYRDTIKHNLETFMSNVAHKLQRVCRYPGNKELYYVSDLQAVPSHPPSVLHVNQVKAIEAMDITQEMIDGFMKKNILLDTAPASDKPEIEVNLRNSLESMAMDAARNYAVEGDVLAFAEFKAELASRVNHEIKMVSIELRATKQKFGAAGDVGRGK